MEFFNRWYNEAAISTLEGIVNSPFERITYTEAVDMLLQSEETFEFPVSWGVDLQSEHERYLTEKAHRPPGDCHRLPEGDQSLLHAAER